ncbi:hypothetical protein V3Q77_14590, partial [Flavobacterium davisii]
MTIPKLELLGATLLTKLINHVVPELRKSIQLDSITTWTDSKIVLAWLRTPPHNLQTFEANRVSQISSSEVQSEWRHIPGNLNPSDCASRGLTASTLLKNYLWWSCTWLLLPHTQWPVAEYNTDSDPNLPGLRCLLTTTSLPAPDPSFLLERFSSFTKLIGVTCYMLRFINKTRNLPVELSVSLSTQER